MAFKAKNLRMKSDSHLSVRVGRKTVAITLELPAERFAEHLVKAVFGKHARVREGKQQNGE